MIRVLVCGGRSYSNAEKVDEVLTQIHTEQTIISIIEGGAKGADSLARTWGLLRGIIVISCPAEWDKYGRAAGPLRNSAMLIDYKPHLVVAFPGGSGTANILHFARARKFQIMEIADAPTHAN